MFASILGCFQKKTLFLLENANPHIIGVWFPKVIFHMEKHPFFLLVDEKVAMRGEKQIHNTDKHGYIYEFGTLTVVVFCSKNAKSVNANEVVRLSQSWLSHFTRFLCICSIFFKVLF